MGVEKEQGHNPLDHVDSRVTRSAGHPDDGVGETARPGSRHHYDPDVDFAPGPGEPVLGDHEGPAAGGVFGDRTGVEDHRAVHGDGCGDRDGNKQEAHHQGQGQEPPQAGPAGWPPASTSRLRSRPHMFISNSCSLHLLGTFVPSWGPWPKPQLRRVASSLTPVRSFRTATTSMRNAGCWRASASFSGPVNR